MAQRAVYLYAAIVIYLSQSFNSEIMSEQNNSGAWFGVGIGLGVIIGGLFIWVIIKSQQSQVPVQTMQSTTPQIPQLPPIKMYPAVTEEIVKMPVEVPLSTYKNNADLIFERDETGRIKSVRNIRDAKITGG